MATVLVSLSRGLFAKIDDKDKAEISRYKWYATTGANVYAVRKVPVGDGKYDTILMHRQITNASTGSHVDHINHDTLDNRRCNLRECPCGLNLANAKLHRDSRTGLKGVSLFKITGKYSASIMVNRRKIHLGYYKSKLDAAMAYDAAAERYFGEFARTNRSMGLI